MRKKLVDDTPQDCFIRSMARCWLSFKQSARRFISDYGYDLTFEQIFVLSAIEEEDGLNLKRLADELDRDRTTITRMIDGLEKRNLVVRVPDKDDNRMKLVYLTRAGKEQLEALRTPGRQFMQEAIKGNSVSEEDILRTSEVLERVADNLEKNM